MLSNLVGLTLSGKLRNEGLAYYYGLSGIELCKQDLNEYENNERNHFKNKLEAGVEILKKRLKQN